LTFQTHSNFVSGVVVMPGRRRVVSASWDRTMKIRDLESGKELGVVARHRGMVIDVAVTAVGRIASASTDYTAKVWGVNGGRELLTFAGHSGQVLAFGCNGGRPRRFDLY